MSIEEAASKNSATEYEKKANYFYEQRNTWALESYKHISIMNIALITVSALLYREQPNLWTV